MSVAERATLRSVLRASTADVHERLERIPAFERLIEGNASMRDYANVLRGHRQFYRVAQAHLDMGYLQLSALGCVVTRKDALHLIEQDLAAIDASCDDAATVPSPVGDAPAVALGWVWVVEGSALGGKVIDRSLGQLLGNARDGRRFFEPAVDMASRWQGVCAALERHGQHEEHRGAVVSGALAAFSCVEHCLREATR